MIIRKLKCAILIAGLSTAMSGFAMEQLNEAEMSAATGQDGLTVKLTPSASNVAGRLGLSNVVYRDRDGISSTQALNFYQPDGTTQITKNLTGSGSVWLNMNTAAGSGIQFCKVLTASCTAPTNLSTQALSMVIDADGGNATGTKPALNIAFTMQSDLKGIKIDLSKVSLRGAAAVSTASAPTTATMTSLRDASSQAYDLVSFSNGIGIDYVSAPTINLTLGNAIGTQTPGFLFSNMNISKLNLGTISILDSGTPANTINADVSVSNLDLSGSRLDINTAGVVFSKAGVLGGTTGFDVAVNNISAGTLGAGSASTDTTHYFNDVANGSMGSLSMTGIKVTNPVTTIKGM